jgi:hypothetical protein
MTGVALLSTEYVVATEGLDYSSLIAKYASMEARRVSL